MTKLIAYFKEMVNEDYVKELFFKLQAITGVDGVWPDIGSRSMTICVQAQQVASVQQAFPVVSFKQVRA